MLGRPVVSCGALGPRREHGGALTHMLSPLGGHLLLNQSCLVVGRPTAGVGQPLCTVAVRAAGACAARGRARYLAPPAQRVPRMAAAPGCSCGQCSHLPRLRPHCAAPSQGWPVRAVAHARPHSPPRRAPGRLGIGHMLQPVAGAAACRWPHSTAEPVAVAVQPA